MWLSKHLQRTTAYSKNFQRVRKQRFKNSISRKWHKPNTYSHWINKKEHHTYVKLSATIVKKYIYVTYLNFTFLQILVSLLLTVFSFEMTYACQLQFLPFWCILTEHWNTRNRPLTPWRHKKSWFHMYLFYNYALQLLLVKQIHLQCRLKNN